MQYKLFLCLFSLFMVAVAAAQQSGVRAVNAADFQISNADAARITQNYAACKAAGNCVKIKKKNKALKHAIKRAARQANDINWINFRRKTVRARFDQQDEEGFRRRWNLSPTDSAGYVGGYSTKLVRYRLHKNKVGRREQPGGLPLPDEQSFSFYDMMQICPPPEPCN